MKTLRSYQQDAVDYCSERQSWALFMEMRLGKTLSTIRAVQSTDAMRILVVAPYSALDGWVKELLEEMEHMIYLDGTGTQRKMVLSYVKGLGPAARRWWLLTNKEAHRTIGDKLREIDFDAIILDESTFIKNPRAAVTKYFLSFPATKYRAILTGTPAPETTLDYFNQLAFLDKSILGHKTYWEYRARRFRPAGFDWVMPEKEKQWLVGKLAQHTFQLKRADVNLSGEKIYERRFCTLPHDVLKTYQTVEAEFLVEYENIVVKKTKIAGVKYSWLRQICGGFINGKLISRHKINCLSELLGGELYGQQVVIWCQYLNEIDSILDSFSSAESISGAVSPRQRKNIIDEFQQGKIQYLICQPETVKLGVRLDAASTMIYYSTPESAMTRQQTEDRTINIGKSDSCLIIDLITDDTIESDIVDSVLKKAVLSERIYQRVKAAKNEN